MIGPAHGATVGGGGAIRSRKLPSTSSILASTPQLRPRGLQDPAHTPTASLRSRRAKNSTPVSSGSVGGPVSQSGNGKASQSFRWLVLMLLGMGLASVVIAVCLVFGGFAPLQDASTAPLFAAAEGSEVGVLAMIEFRALVIWCLFSLRVLWTTLGFPIVVTASFPSGQVTHGSVIKLMHDKTKFRLHSHEVPYGSGSGQQSVTGFPGVEDSNSYWVRPTLLNDLYGPCSSVLLESLD